MQPRAFGGVGRDVEAEGCRRSAKAGRDGDMARLAMVVGGRGVRDVRDGANHVGASTSVERNQALAVNRALRGVLGHRLDLEVNLLGLGETRSGGSNAGEGSSESSVDEHCEERETGFVLF